MKFRPIIVSLALTLLFVGCTGAPPAVSKSKQDQVALVTQTGIYSYQRALGPPRAR